jgi:hypothetical protein
MARIDLLGHRLPPLPRLHRPQVFHMGGEGHGADPMGVRGQGEGGVRQRVEEAAVGGAVKVQALWAHHPAHPGPSGPRDPPLQP